MNIRTIVFGDKRTFVSSGEELQETKKGFVYPWRGWQNPDEVSSAERFHESNCATYSVCMAINTLYCCFIHFEPGFEGYAEVNGKRFDSIDGKITVNTKSDPKNGQIDFVIKSDSKWRIKKIVLVASSSISCSKIEGESQVESKKVYKYSCNIRGRELLHYTWLLDDKVQSYGHKLVLNEDTDDAGTISTEIILEDGEHWLTCYVIESATGGLAEVTKKISVVR